LRFADSRLGGSNFFADLTSANTFLNLTMLYLKFVLNRTSGRTNLLPKFRWYCHERAEKMLNFLRTGTPSKFWGFTNGRIKAQEYSGRQYGNRGGRR
jgi:hypothetical protein